MKTVLLTTFLGFVLWNARGDAPPQQPLAAQGELIITQFVSAPFPHPKRAGGHQYHDKFFDAKNHYSDSTVAIFVPKGFRETGRIDLVVHFHGWNNNVTNVLQKYKLIAQFIESGRNAVLVVPQGPRDASDSFGGKLEDPDGFRRFVYEVKATLLESSSLKRKDFSMGRIILSGHSGGYQVISSVVDHGGLSDQVQEVWLFDALYAQTDKFLAWSSRPQTRLLNIYTEHGGTKSETEKTMATLKQSGSEILAGKEDEVTQAQIRTNHYVFLFTDLPHDEVVASHNTFRDFLMSSCLDTLGENSGK
jgi:hypothetical protein